jgi:hypothetical protein
MPIIRSIVSWLSIKRTYQVDLFKNYPFDVQQEVFFKLLERAKATEWGVKHGFADMASIKQFQQRVPLQTYEEVKPYVERLRNGETDLLWPGEIKWFAKSSGTTNDKSKFIPVSKEALEDCHYRGGKDIVALYLQNFPETKMLKGKGLTLGGSHKLNNDAKQNYYGDLSAILIQNLPFWADFIKTPNRETALMDEWEAKMEKIASETQNENVTSIAGVPSWMLVLIKYILEYTGKKNVLEIWPNLELFVHGGISFTPYKEQFRKLIPTNGMNYMETYNASEGFFAIQDDPCVSDMLLMLDLGVFFEFIPMDEFDQPNPRVLCIDEVEKGVNYALVISTNGGLWRYIIGDTVKFTSLFPHKICITGRTKHFINAFGEELIIDNAEKALDISCEKTHAQINDFTAAPIFMDENSQGAHEWIIEFEKLPNNLDYFAAVLDDALKSLNSDYEAKRYKDYTLKMPKLLAVKKGTFYTWLHERGKLGGQNKVPRLSNSRQYVEELKSIHDRLK